MPHHFLFFVSKWLGVGVFFMESFPPCFNRIPFKLFMSHIRKQEIPHDRFPSQLNKVWMVSKQFIGLLHILLKISTQILAMCCPRQILTRFLLKFVSASFLRLRHVPASDWHWRLGGHLSPAQSSMSLVGVC